LTAYYPEKIFGCNRADILTGILLMMSLMFIPGTASSSGNAENTAGAKVL